MRNALFIILFICPGVRGIAQKPSKVVSFDTIKIVQSKVFDYISSNIDSIALENFIPFQKGSSNTIYYINKDTSESFYKNLFRNPGFRYLLEQKITNKPVKINANEKKIFFKEVRFANTKETYYYLLILPLVSFNEKIYCHLYVKSANVNGTIYMGEMNFIFNEAIELIKTTYGDSIID